MVRREDIPEAMHLNNRLQHFEAGIERLQSVDTDQVNVVIDFPDRRQDNYKLSTKVVLECLEGEAKKYRAQLEKLGIWFPA